LASLVFKGSYTAQLVDKWLENLLLKEIDKLSIIIMDNAPVHNKKFIKNLLEEYGHTMLVLSPYSPDFNPIEQSFGAMKKRREGMPITTTENLILSYS